MDRSEQEGGGEWLLRQFLVFFNFSATEDKGDCFSGVGDPTMILEQVSKGTITR
jgi:hypothetical protein